MGNCCGVGVGRSAAASAQVAPLLFERLSAWCDEAERGLALALGDYADAIREGVITGRMELWRIDGGASWLVTEVISSESKLVAWCYQGRDVRRLTAALVNITKRNRLEVLEYATRRKGLPRMLKEFGFDLAAIDEDGINVFQLVVADD